MDKKPLIVSFSGGRSSGFMSKWLIDNTSHIFDLRFVFANTGQEHENTLKFVDQCDKAFGLNLTWLEADVTPKKGVATRYNIVTYETANRDGKVFEDMIRKYGIPNKEYPHCTRELKIQPITMWLKDLGLADATRALGIRADEPKRIKRKDSQFYPLVDLVPVCKQDVLDWWRTQDFDLDLPEHMGNCVFCWKKSLKKLLTLAKADPMIFEFPLMMEAKYRHIITNPEVGHERVFFRERRETVDLLMMAQGEFKEYVDLHHEECAEECGSMIPEDVETEEAIDNSAN